MSKEDGKASRNPLLAISDERSGSSYARAVGCKGVGEDGSMSWLIEDISGALKSWGDAWERVGILNMKSDGEPSILTLKEAAMK